MPSYTRLKNPGGCYFFTVVTYKRRKVLCLPEVRTALRQAINNVRQTMPFEIVAWVLLSDHLHCIWTLPEGDSNYAMRWAKIKSQVTRQCKHIASQNLTTTKTTKGELGFWQSRFWEHQIRDKKDLENHLNYIHYNPVKHGFCQIASQWQFSTLHRYIKQHKYSENWGEGINIPEGTGSE